MAAEYYLEVRSPTGTVLGQIDDFWDLAFYKGVNEPGWVQTSIDANHSKLSLLSDKSQILVMRSDPEFDLAPYEEICGIYRKQQYSTTDRDTLKIECPGIQHMLAWRVNAFASDVANRSKFTSKSPETIMKTLVSYNFTSLATTGNNRKRNGQITTPYTITVAADSNRGSSMDRSNSGVNILKELQEIAGIGGLDFSLTRTGAASWQFDVGVPYLGSDKHTSVIFDLEKGNMADPSYLYDAIDEKTVAVVAGQDQKLKRQFAIRTSSAYSTSNDIEVWVDARNDGDTTAGLNSAGDKALRANRVKQEFSYKVRQSPSTRYKVDYDIGDLVQGRYLAIDISQKVQSVTITYDNATGKEDIDIGLKNA